MQRIKYRSSLMLLSFLSTIALVAAPVSALASAGSESTPCTTPASQGQVSPDVRCGPQPVGGVRLITPDSSSSNESSNASTTTTPTSTPASQGGLHQQAEELLQQKRQEIKEHTQAEKQKACQAHQKDINARAKAYATAAQSHLNTFNDIFTKVQKFYTDKKLTVANYDTLVATAKTKQTAAQAAVGAVKALNVSIDCSSSDPATTVATLKTAVANARTALQDYRTAIKNVIVALQGASSASNGNTSAGGNQ